MFRRLTFPQGELGERYFQLLYTAYASAPRDEQAKDFAKVRLDGDLKRALDGVSQPKRTEGDEAVPEHVRPRALKTRTLEVTQTQHSTMKGYIETTPWAPMTRDAVADLWDWWESAPAQQNPGRKRGR